MLAYNPNKKDPLMISKRKKLLLLLSLLLATLAFSTSAQAELDNNSCVRVYRDGALDLLDVVEDYNNKSLNRGSFYTEVTGIGASVKTLRAACYFVESPEVDDCVNSYKKIYKDLRGHIRLRAVMAGNQDKVKLPFGYKLKMMGKVTIQDTVCNVR
jgi:hypothetical protein